MAQAKLKSMVQDDLGSVIDEAIRDAGGDMRAAIMGLIPGQQQMEVEANDLTSSGYVRRGLRQ